jgi:hypothetical protein
MTATVTKSAEAKPNRSRSSRMARFPALTPKFRRRVRRSSSRSPRSGQAIWLICPQAKDIRIPIPPDGIDEPLRCGTCRAQRADTEPPVQYARQIVQRRSSGGRRSRRVAVGTYRSVIRWSRVPAPPVPLNSPLLIQQVDPRPRADAVFAEIRDGRWPTAFRANALRRAGWLPAPHLSRHARTR